MRSNRTLIGQERPHDLRMLCETPSGTEEGCVEAPVRHPSNLAQYPAREVHWSHPA